MATNQDRGEKVVCTVGAGGADALAGLRAFADDTGKVDVAAYLGGGGDPLRLCDLKPGGIIPPATENPRRVTLDSAGILRVYRGTQGRPETVTLKQAETLAVIMADDGLSDNVREEAGRIGWDKATAAYGIQSLFVPKDHAEWDALRAFLVGPDSAE